MIRRIEELERTQQNTNRTTNAHITRGNAVSNKRAMSTKLVREINWEDLDAVDAKARLNLFFMAISRCTDDDDERIEIATAKMGITLAMAVNERITIMDIKDWGSFCEFIISNFIGKKTFHQAWLETNKFTYDGIMTPQQFVSQLRGKFDALAAQFPGAELPKFNSQVKHKLCEILPRDAKDKLAVYMSASYSLDF